jgi:predicted ATPase with chaperone activity
MIQRYMAKISGPLMDRMDIHIDAPAVNYKEMRAAHEPESSGKIRERVIRAPGNPVATISTSRTLLRQCANGAGPHPHFVRTFRRL